MSDDLVKRLRDCANGLGNFKNDLGDFGLCNTAADRIEELEKQNASLEAKLAKAVEALDSVMVGGNHLATILPDNFPPAETEPLIALETMGYGYDFEVWCCWRSIMLARSTLAEINGEQP